MRYVYKLRLLYFAFVYFAAVGAHASARYSFIFHLPTSTFNFQLTSLIISFDFAFTLAFRAMSCALCFSIAHLRLFKWVYYALRTAKFP